jgi:hypothetical protein
LARARALRLCGRTCPLSQPATVRSETRAR